jgi:hypothetical protein
LIDQEGERRFDLGLAFGDRGLALGDLLKQSNNFRHRRNLYPQGLCAAGIQTCPRRLRPM